jgi:hypothetical protein
VDSELERSTQSHMFYTGHRLRPVDMAASLLYHAPHSAPKQDTKTA